MKKDTMVGEFRVAVEGMRIEDAPVIGKVTFKSNEDPLDFAAKLSELFGGKDVRVNQVGCKLGTTCKHYS